MQLTLFTDYTLRTLIYLGVHPGQVVPAASIAEAYGISVDHTAKAAKWLTQRGYVRALRGKTGGVSLACAPESVVLGRLVRETEPDLDLVECFRGAENRCPITPACRLKHALHRARAAFLGVLDEYTLADVLSERRALLQLLPLRLPG